MAESLQVVIDAPEVFSACVHGTAEERVLPESGDLAFVTKDDATLLADGITRAQRAAVCVTFTVQLPDGSMARAQSVTTLRLLKRALRLLDEQYDDDGRRRA